MFNLKQWLLGAVHNRLNAFHYKRIKCIELPAELAGGECNLNQAFNRVWALQPRVTSPHEHVILFNLAAVSTESVVEVGCYLCYSTVVMASALKGSARVVHAIDMFDRNRGCVSAGSDNWIFSKFDQEEYAKKIVEDCGCGQNVKLYAMSSREAAPLIAATGPAGLVFIDGDHSYEGCMEDLKNYAPLVASGGFLVLHDYICLKWPGVRRAVDEFSSNNPGFRRMSLVNSMLIMRQK